MYSTTKLCLLAEPEFIPKLLRASFKLNLPMIRGNPADEKLWIIINYICFCFRVSFIVVRNWEIIKSVWATQSHQDTSSSLVSSVPFETVTSWRTPLEYLVAWFIHGGTFDLAVGSTFQPFFINSALFFYRHGHFKFELCDHIIRYYTNL